MRGRTEEHRAGECDSDHRVGAVGQHLIPDQMAESGLAGSLGGARGDHLSGEASGDAPLLWRPLRRRLAAVVGRSVELAGGNRALLDRWSRWWSRIRGVGRRVWRCWRLARRMVGVPRL